MKKAFHDPNNLPKPTVLLKKAFWHIQNYDENWCMITEEMLDNLDSTKARVAYDTIRLICSNKKKLIEGIQSH